MHRLLIVYLTKKHKQRSLKKLTTVISLPAAFRKAFVQRTLRGFLFILKFLWHLLLQNTVNIERMTKKDKPKFILFDTV